MPFTTRLRSSSRREGERHASGEQKRNPLSLKFPFTARILVSLRLSQTLIMLRRIGASARRELESNISYFGERQRSKDKAAKTYDGAGAMMSMKAKRRSFSTGDSPCSGGSTVALLCGNCGRRRDLLGTRRKDCRRTTIRHHACLRRTCRTGAFRQQLHRHLRRQSIHANCRKRIAGGKQNGNAVRIESCRRAFHLCLSDAHPISFGQERTGYLVTDMSRAIAAARSAGAEVIVEPFKDAIGSMRLSSGPAA